ncbi:MAG: hypothetical protein A4E73_01092 [Syntrophaceae bacterium PtaU1.Bin231]|nr:MAG: hypothetical protein A4E73_01092 [Syntrophaceae bacterium PtaU1.Bin231]
MADPSDSRASGQTTGIRPGPGLPGCGRRRGAAVRTGIASRPSLRSVSRIPAGQGPAVGRRRAASRCGGMPGGDLAHAGEGLWGRLPSSSGRKKGICPASSGDVPGCTVRPAGTRLPVRHFLSAPPVSGDLPRRVQPCGDELLPAEPLPGILDGYPQRTRDRQDEGTESGRGGNRRASLPGLLGNGECAARLLRCDGPRLLQCADGVRCGGQGRFRRNGRGGHSGRDPEGYSLSARPPVAEPSSVRRDAAVGRGEGDAGPFRRVGRFPCRGLYPAGPFMPQSDERGGGALRSSARHVR